MICFVGLAPSQELAKTLTDQSLSWSTFDCPTSLPKGSLIICNSKHLFLTQELVKAQKDKGFYLLVALTPHKAPPFEGWLAWEAVSWEHTLVNFLPFYKQWRLLFAQWEHSEKQLHDLLLKTNKLVDQFQKDLDFASTIQRTLLPSSEITLPGISVTTKYIPAAGLGGDYFDIFELSDKRHLGILVADSQTHGMAAALLSVLLKLHVDEFKALASSSKSLVEHLNQSLYQIHLSKLPGLNFFFGVLDRTTLSFEFTTAGNLVPLLFTSSQLKQICSSEYTNPPLGIQPNTAFSAQSLQLKPGDLLFLHTDGLNAVFKEKEDDLFLRLEQLFSSTKTVDPLTYQTELLAKLNKVKEEQSELPDDVTLIQLFVDQRALYLAQSK